MPATDRNTDVPDAYVRLVDVAKRVRANGKVEPLTVRELLQWFGATRREDRIISEIRAALYHLDLRTEPWFEQQSWDGKLTFAKTYWGGSHTPTEYEKIAENQLHERENITDTLVRQWHLELYIRLVQRHITAWIGRNRRRRQRELTRSQVQARANSLMTRSGSLDQFLKQFSEPEILATIVDITLTWGAAKRQFIDAEIRTGRSTEGGYVFSLPAPKGFATLGLDGAPDAVFRHYALVAPPVAEQKRVGDNVVYPNFWRSHSFRRVSEPPLTMYRVQAAPLSFVRPRDSVETAMSKMKANHLSQLPVMENERSKDIRGVISWESIVERIRQEPKIALDGMVGEYMRRDPPRIPANRLLMHGIAEIVEHQYALVMDAENRLVSVVATKDLAKTLKEVAEPFLLIKDIELRLRVLMEDVFAPEDLEKVTRDGFKEKGRCVKDVHDLDLGDCVLLLQNRDFWDRLGLAEDRNIVVEKLQEIREIRNNIMHFYPEGIAPERLDTLHKTTSFILGLQPRRGMSPTPLKSAC